MQVNPVPAICYDLPTVSQFFRSVALLVAMQKHTSVEWVEHRDSSSLNVIYGMLFWKTAPGTVEVSQASNRIITAETDSLHEKYLDVWLKKLMNQGPGAANVYISHMANLREDVRGFIDGTFHDALELNRAIVGETSDGIKNLARIKLGGTIGVAILGAAGAIVLAPVGALVVSGISLGYSSSCALIKTWEHGGTAKAVGIEVSKAAGSEALGKFAEARQIKALADQAKAQHVIRSAEGVIRKQTQRLAQEGLRKAHIRKGQSLLQSSTRQIAQQQQVLTQAGKLARIASAAKIAVPIVFAAADIWGAMIDYDETINSL